MKNILFIGHILPNCNNVYETNLISELKRQVDKLEIISINKGYRDLECSFLEIPLHVVKAKKKPLIDEILRFFYILKLLNKWDGKNNNVESRIILMNASIEITLAVLFFSKFYNIKTYCLIIDTALGNFKPDTLWNKFNYCCFFLSEKLYKFFDGSIAVNANVFDYLNLNKKPHLLSRIGYSSVPLKTLSNKTNDNIEIIYTGSLINYDGIHELLDAISTFECYKVCLTIYGNGPLRGMVESYASKCKNIKYGGILPFNKISDVLKKADYLINPRISYSFTDIFGFPSKMVEYLLSGTPVITTSYAAMPKEYKNFTFIIEDESSEGIKNAILRAITCEEETKLNMVKKAYQYIVEHNHYVDIVNEILAFIY